MTTEANKAVVRRFIEARNAWDLDALDELVTPDCAPRTLARAFAPSERPGGPGGVGPKAWKATLRQTRAAMPDSRVVVEAVLAEGDRVIQIERVEGTHTEHVFGRVVPTAAGRRVSFSGVRLYELRDGKIAAYTNVWDWLDYFQQLGVLPPTPQILDQAAASSAPDAPPRPTPAAE